MIYKCSACSREIGWIADKDNNPCSFYCPHAGRIAQMAGYSWVQPEKKESVDE